jgi:hypothetical protein
MTSEEDREESRRGNLKALQRFGGVEPSTSRSENCFRHGTDPYRSASIRSRAFSSRTSRPHMRSHSRNTSLSLSR